MEIIDAQIHRPLPLEPWDSPVLVPLEAQIELSVAAMEAVGVDRALIYSGVEFCQAAASRYPDKFAGVLDLQDPSEVGDPDLLMLDLKARSDVVAVRLLPGWPYSGANLTLLTEGLWEPTLSAAARHEIPVVIFLPLHLRLLSRLLKNRL